jgi:hypothetical protein
MRRQSCRPPAEAPPLIHRHLIRSPDHQSTATDLDPSTFTSPIWYIHLEYLEGRNATALRL